MQCRHLYLVLLLLLQFGLSSMEDEILGSCEDGTCATGEAEVTQEEEDKLPLCPYPPPNLGDFEVDLTPLPLEEAQAKNSAVRSGGTWWPEDCTSRQTVAVIVPYRDRLEDLLVFLPNIHQFLRHQLLNYTIFLVEQWDKKHFNRASLLNIGFQEAQKVGPYDCVIFHDVDKFPEDTRNLYMCTDKPTHLITKQRYVGKKEYRERPYEEYFGGVTAITSNHFRLVNGFSNMFWGWGSEDDDFLARVKHHGLETHRVEEEVGRYREIWHPYGFVNPKRHEVKKNGPRRFINDGIISLQYTMMKKEKRSLYTYFGVRLDHLDPYDVTHNEKIEYKLHPSN